MQIKEKGCNGVSLIPADTQLMAGRRLFVEGEITTEAALDFVKKVMLLNFENPHSPIDVFVNSLGGEINAGMMMYDVIQGSATPIRMYCVGRAYSMGAVLFAGGNHGRYMLPHSELMIHEPLLGNRVGGTSSSIKSISDSLLETRRMINQILSKHTGRSEEEIEAATGFDHYFSPEESVSFGLCDQIMSFDKMIEEGCI